MFRQMVLVIALAIVLTVATLILLRCRSPKSVPLTVVVAACGDSENVKAIREMVREKSQYIPLRVYNKCGFIQGAESLPNVGRDFHTFLHYDDDRPRAGTHLYHGVPKNASLKGFLMLR